MVKGWVNSPGHYKNIITPEYQITGLAISRHPASGNIIAVQKFAKVLWKYTFSENKRMFIYSTDTVPRYETQRKPLSRAENPEKLPWKLQPLDYKQTKSCEKCEALLKQQYKITPWIEKDQLYAVSTNAAEVLKTFKKQAGWFGFRGSSL
jgi:hypothetical protein